MAVHWTRHGLERKDERGMTDDHIAAAMAGRVLYDRLRNVTICCDSRSRTAVVIKNNRIVTVMRALPSQIKRSFGLYGREKGE
jgi:hypothetical protein